jgi:hypothetical protein
VTALDSLEPLINLLAFALGLALGAALARGGLL